MSKAYDSMSEPSMDFMITVFRDPVDIPSILHLIALGHGVTSDHNTDIFFKQKFSVENYMYKTQGIIYILVCYIVNQDIVLSHSPKSLSHTTHKDHINQECWCTDNNYPSRRHSLDFLPSSNLIKFECKLPSKM